MDPKPNPGACGSATITTPAECGPGERQIKSLQIMEDNTKGTYWASLDEGKNWIPCYYNQEKKIIIIDYPNPGK